MKKILAMLIAFVILSSCATNRPPAIETQANIDLPTFMQIAIVLQELGYSKHRHGEIELTQRTIEFYELVDLHFRRAAARAWAGDSLVEDWASWGAQQESYWRYFVIAFDSALADTLGPLPVGCGYWDPMQRVLFDRNGMIIQ